VPQSPSGETPAPALDAADSTLGPDQQAMRRDSFRKLNEQVDSLPDEERAVVDLHFYQGLPLPQAAEALDVSLATVKRRWMAARLRLGEQLQGEAG
jgi:RNA polymerase sigma factor (sigma-70 family)